MNYKIFIERSAQKALSKVPVRDQNRMIESIQNLSDNPRPSNAKKLTARSGWRIRIGNYRVIFEIEDDRLIITVISIGHRKDIYK